MKLNEYKAKLAFWWAKKTIKDGRDFEVSMDDVGMLVHLTSGKFKGVTYRYSPLKVISEDGLVDFHTYVEYTPKDVDITDPKFAKHTTTILRLLLEEAIPETVAQAKAQVIDENRDTDFSEPLEERSIHEESSPVLEKRVSKRKSRAKTVRPDQPVHSEIQQPAKPKRPRARTSRTKRPK